MTWQDIVLSVGQWVFIIALMPSVLGKDKPALITSAVTALVLLSFVVALATLSLWVASLSTLATAIIWGILAVQKYMIKKRE